jgi:hypothetical protein
MPYAYQPSAPVDNLLSQNENFVAYYKQMVVVGNQSCNASRLPPAKPPKRSGTNDHHTARAARKSAHKKRNSEIDEQFQNSLSHQLINELVGTIGDEDTVKSNSTANVDVKHSESNTTNHSTGDSQNSSSAEKVERRCSTVEVDENGVASGRSSSSSSSSSNGNEETCCVPNESLRSFITDSPFSFRNPIFFSVPRD